MRASGRVLADDEVDLIVELLDAGPVHMYADRAAGPAGPPRFLTTPNLERLVGGPPAGTAELFAMLDRLVEPEHRARLEDARAMSAARRSGTVELKLRDIEGRSRWWRIVAEARGGGVVLGFIWDVNPEIEAAAAEASARADAEQSRDHAVAASRAKTEFLSRMSHELRTPLNSIVGFAQLLELQELAGSEREWVDSIVVASRHLLTLIDDVLDVVGIESGRLQVSLEPVEVVEVVDEAVVLLAGACEEHGVVVERRTSASEVWATGDRQRLLQVLLAVCDNAVRYNRPAGSVVIEATVSAHQVLIEITDTGPGVADDEVERAFQPFDRLGSERVGIEGRGMGLAVARSLVDRMHGSLTMRSAGEGGCTVELALPSAQRPAIVDDVTGLGGAGPGAAPLTILYIEDNVANLRLMESVLELRPSVTLITAMRAELGIAIARDQRPDLALVDLHLPDLDGAEVVRRLRDDPRTASLPVVVVSADATQARIDEATRLGADHYVTKPIDIHELIAIVDLHLERAGHMGGI